MKLKKLITSVAGIKFNNYFNFLRVRFKSIGSYKALKAIESAISINRMKTENLIMYGESYSKTMVYASLELAEKVAYFKCEFYKALFHIK